MWTEGHLMIGKNTYYYAVKHYEEGSEYGINSGRISKMGITRHNKIVYNYDRELDVPPADKETEKAVKILLDRFN